MTGCLSASIPGVLDDPGAQRHEMAGFQRLAGPFALAGAGNALQVLDLGANRRDQVRTDGELFEQGPRHLQARGREDDAVEGRNLRQA